MPNTMAPLRSAVIKSHVIYLSLAEGCHNVRKDTETYSQRQTVSVQTHVNLALDFLGVKLNVNEPVIHHLASTSFIGNCSYCRSPAC